MDLSGRRIVLCDAAGAAVAWLYLDFAYVVVEYGLEFVPVCPTRLLLGISCPLCGSTRLIGRYLHGEFAIGIGQLPGLVWFLFVGWAGMVASVRLFTHRSASTIQDAANPPRIGLR